MLSAPALMLNARALMLSDPVRLLNAPALSAPASMLNDRALSSQPHVKYSCSDVKSQQFPDIVPQATCQVVPWVLSFRCVAAMTNAPVFSGMAAMMNAPASLG